MPRDSPRHRLVVHEGGGAWSFPAVPGENHPRLWRSGRKTPSRSRLATRRRRERRRLQPLLPVFLLHRRPERGFTKRIASVFISSPGFPLSGGGCPSLPEICSAADPRLLRRELRSAGSKGSGCCGGTVLT